MSESSPQASRLRSLHGRQLNTKNEEYMLPSDAPEMKRLNTQHRMLLLAMGGLYPDKYGDIIRRRLQPREGETIEIADLGSGSGDWISDISKAFPHVKAIGMDLAPSIPDGVAPNVRFELRDVTENMDEYKGRFDLVQARCIGNGILDYPAFIASMSRLLKPGGVLLLLEGYVQLYDQELNIMPPNNGVTKLMAEVVSRQPNPSKTKLNRLGDHLEGWLKESSELKNVTAEALYIPIGWSGSLDYCKDPVGAGRLMVDNTKVFAASWTPMFLSMGLPEEDVNRWISDAMRELEEPEKLKCYTKWIVLCAQKVE